MNKHFFTNSEYCLTRDLINSMFRTGVIVPPVASALAILDVYIQTFQLINNCK